MVRRHAPFDKKKKKRGAMYCRCALFQFFRNLSLEFSKNRKKMFVAIRFSSFAD
jgi:hypothetical protein